MDLDEHCSTSKNSQLSLMNTSLFLLLMISGLLFLSLLITLNSSNPLFSSLSHRHQHSDELDEVLGKASMPNKTVIIAVVNKAYVEGQVMPAMLDLFLEGFWAGEGTRDLLSHLIIVAVDQTAYIRCHFRGLNCYRLPTDGADFMGEQVFMSTPFIDMMWRRTLFLLQVLNKGYSFIFTDTDVIWLRNPFIILTTEGTQELDIQFSTDFHNGNSSSSKNPINTGFYYVKSNEKTISLFEKWYGLKDSSSGLKEQDVLQNLTWHGGLASMGIHVRFLETRYFSGFCQDSPDIRAVITVHANCCRFISAKIMDLTRVIHEWVQFRSNPPNETSSFQWSKHSECIKSWIVGTN